MDKDDISKIKYEFFEYENSPIEISDIDSIRTQNPLFFLEEEDLDFFDLNLPETSEVETPKLTELKKDIISQPEIQTITQNQTQTQTQNQPDGQFESTTAPPIPMFGNSFQNEKNVPFLQQQYFSSNFVQPQGFMQPNTNYTFQQPNIPETMNYFQDAQTQFHFLNQRQGISNEETFQMWNNFQPQIRTEIQQRTVNYIKIIEGFNQPLRGKKQPGGKDNLKHFLPRQTIELSVDLLPKTLDPKNLSCRASVCGFDRVKRDRLILSDLDEQKFTEENNYKINFDELLVKYSSHLNGQKLSLRFSLVDSQTKKLLSFIDSYEFETITKRGKEKQVEREKRKRTEDDDDVYISHVSPNIGSSMGGQLVKIFGHGFISPPLNSTIIKFGNTLVKEIHSIKRNTIVCEVPPGGIGSVPISVSFDKQNFITSDANFQYVDPNTQEGLTFLLQSMFNQKKPSIQKKE
eukprot:gene1945-1453_t